MFEAGLVLEGGGMRGLFTAGVLDLFLDKQIHFRGCIGVSAGACHGVSYVCGQRGRARDVSVDYLKDKNYCGMHSLLTTGDMFNVEMVYKTIPEQYYPLDVEAFVNSGTALYAVVTNCDTGQAEYVRIRHPYQDLGWIRASASLPLVSHKVQINGGRYLDGGITDSIPLQKSIEMGNQKNVVILTQPKGYRKKPDSLYPLMKLRYQRHKGLRQQMKNRHLQYNRTIDLVEGLEAEGKLFVIRPSEALNIGRVEKDKYKLLQIYKNGYEEGEKTLSALLRYLNDTEVKPERME